MAHHRSSLALALCLSVAAPAALPKSDLTDQRRQFREAYSAYRNGDVGRGAQLAEGLEGYPLSAYLHYEALRRQLDTVSAEEIRAFIGTEGGSRLGEQLRGEWLEVLARKGRWQELVAIYAPQKDRALHCRYLSARVLLGQTEGLFQTVREIWLTGESLPKGCDPALAWFKEQPAFNDDLLWDRIALAMDAGNTQFAAHLAGPLDAESKRLVALWRDLRATPAATLARCQPLANSARGREVVRYGIERLARQDAAKADAQWQDLKTQHAWSPAEQAEIAAAIAVAAVRQDHADALALLDKVPSDYAHESVQRAKLMAALEGLEWRRLARWTEQPAAADMNALRWRYWRGRALEELGDSAAAKEIYKSLAAERDYYGWVAAERLGLAYEFKHEPTRVLEPEVASFLTVPSIVRAREFFELDMSPAARREWHYYVNRMDPRLLPVAAVAAHRWGWHDRAIAALGKARQYADLEIRFPLAFLPQVEEYARKRGIETAVMLSVIRSESAFGADARSPAGALGLMQVMPATGRATAKHVGLPLKGEQQLLDAEHNLNLGSAYLKAMLDRFGGSLVLAAAAYNAGPHRAAKWRPRSHCVAADVWVDTIPFTETRRYVRNVLFFTALYESRLKQAGKPAQQRLAVMPTDKAGALSCQA